MALFFISYLPVLIYAQGPLLTVETPLAQGIEGKEKFIGNMSDANMPRTDIFNLTSGYKIEPVVWNLTASDSITFDNDGNMYIAEAGYPYTGLPEVPKILKVYLNNNTLTVFANTKLNSPITDIVFHDGLLYVSHRDKISTIDMNGKLKDIIVGLPSNGDHHNDQIAFSPDGKKLYFGQGTATNSAIVGLDNFEEGGWLGSLPTIHDVPAKDIVLTGQNFETENPLTADPKDKAITGAFVPFGNATKKGQVIKGDTKCNGCILSANLDGTDLKVVGWGFRNPYGLAFDKDNNSTNLIVTAQGAEERGSRPIANDKDKIYEIKLNNTAFYGYPDFVGNAEPVTDPKFNSSRSDKPLQFLMQDHPPIEKPLTLLERAHTAALQLAFSKQKFGFNGDGFVAQFGTHAPHTGPELNTSEVIGQDIVRVNVDNGTIIPFMTLYEKSPLFHPVDVVFSNDDTSLYVVDWGKFEHEKSPSTYANTGIIWKITPTSEK